MDDVRLGQAVRATRVRRRLRQVDVAVLAGTPAATVSRLERGLIDGLAVATIRRIARVLELRIELLPRSRGADLDRLIRARHAALAEDVLRWLRGFGWEVRPELSFASFGERGIIDLVAWHPDRRSLVVVELKTEIVDVGELLGTLDRKIRLGPQVVGRLGWRPLQVGACLVVAEGMRNRRAVAAHRDTFRSALPDGIRELRAWLRSAQATPTSAQATSAQATSAQATPASSTGPRALVFFSNSRQRNVRSAYAPVQRVRKPRAGPAERAVRSRATAETDRAQLTIRG